MENNVRLTDVKPTSDSEASMLAHFNKAKELKNQYVEEQDNAQRNRLFNEIYFHESQAEGFRRLTIKNSNRMN